MILCIRQYLKMDRLEEQARELAAQGKTDEGARSNVRKILDTIVSIARGKSD